MPKERNKADGYREKAYEGDTTPDLKRGVLSEDGIWNLLSDYRDIQKKKQ